MESANSYKSINILLFILTLVAGVLWGIGGEYLLQDFLNESNHIPIAGAYYTILFGLVIAACLLSEKIKESLVSEDFFYKYTIFYLKITIPVSLLMVFCLACLFQFIYSLEINVTKEPEIITTVVETSGVDDYYFVIDDSGSLWANDPHNIRIGVLNNMVDEMPGDKRISLIRFGGSVGVDYAIILQELTQADSEGKRIFKNHVNKFNSSGPTTDILYALGLNEKVIDKSTTRSSMVILITDGEHSDEIRETPSLQYIVDTYTNLKIPVYSIFLGSQFTSNSMNFLNDISAPTGGRVILVEDMNNFQEELRQVVTVTHQTTRKTVRTEMIRNLLLKRDDYKEHSPLYAFLRIIMITIIGITIAYCITIIFQSRYLTLPFIIGGFISGLAAGIIAEVFLQSNNADHSVIRLIHTVLLSFVLWSVAGLTGFILSRVFGINTLYIFSPSLKDNHIQDNNKGINDINKEKQGRSGNIGGNA